MRCENFYQKKAVCRSLTMGMLCYEPDLTDSALKDKVKQLIKTQKDKAWPEKVATPS